jgi:cytochrome b pre-mRNA-processing protein 3
VFTRLFGRPPAARIAPAIYGAIVTQARSPALYEALGVPDTVGGRFEMVVLHLFLVLRRLERGERREASVGQEVFDLFCGDMDRALRELGVGDLGVPRRMREMGQAFYGRSRAYADGLANRDGPALAEALARNAFKDASPAHAALPLARYALAAAATLDEVAPAALIAEPIPFPDPARFATPVGAAR